MIKTIKEFIIVFKNTYKTYYSQKIQAKESIKEYKIKLKNIEQVKNAMRDIYFKFDVVYPFLPKTERKDFVQKTIDLLHYGRLGKDNLFISLDGYAGKYHYLFENMERKMRNLKEHYNKGDYGTVINLVREYTNELENFYIENDIITK